jgi:hypothetical protein
LASESLSPIIVTRPSELRFHQTIREVDQ